jgi:hypothetical protein
MAPLLIEQQTKLKIKPIRKREEKGKRVSLFPQLLSKLGVAKP